MAYLSTSLACSQFTKSPCFVTMPSCSCGVSVGKSELEESKAATIRVIAQKEDILRALLACQTQNRTTVPSKSGDNGHILSLTHNAVRGDDLEVRKVSLDDKLGEYLFLEVNRIAATGKTTSTREVRELER